MRAFTTSVRVCSANSFLLGGFTRDQDRHVEQHSHAAAAASGSTDHARPSFSEVLDTGIESEDSFRARLEQWDYRPVCFIQLTARLGRETCSS